ncbi:probable carboxylesterase 13 [Rhododendron vialii]|uniref:probable carboxylesterase 13 n=1 Tax=Rhododendron vialii TaxID=182163 RepID=UPI00265E0E6B|nr:probable carboxylesterase 13 [Rhododendron vialii]
MFRPLFISCLLISFGGIASSHPEELQVFFQFFFKVYKNGTIEKLDGHGLDVPASLDSETGVQTKDIVISPETNVSARVYATKDAAASKGGVPLLVYFHGGGFSTGTAAYYAFHQFVCSVVAKGKVVAVSVSYRLAPEHCLPIGYDDSWAAIKWVASHAVGGGTEPWLKERVDFNSIYFLGESAGANIAHNMAMRFGSEKLDGVELKGIVLIHPYFLLKEPTRSLLAVNEEMRNNITKLWPYVCPSTSGPSDPRVNPVADPDLKKLGGKRVLICLAEQDPLMDAGKKYGQALRREGGKVVKKFVSKGKSHVFHLREPNSKEALDLIDRVVSFVDGKSRKTQ